jgi:hypothetical protein
MHGSKVVGMLLLGLSFDLRVIREGIWMMKWVRNLDIALIPSYS